MPNLNPSEPNAQPAQMDIKLVAKPDELGLGRVIVNGRYYGLPVAVVLEFQRLREEQARQRQTETYCKNLASVVDSMENMPAHLAKYGTPD
jgi:hypothetical protein